MELEQGYHVLEITPDMARVFLSQLRPGQRNVDRRQVDRLARIFEVSGGMVSSSMAICFDTNGNLADGQHRCHAITKIDKPVTLMVRYDVSEEELYAMHNCRPRSMADQLKMQCNAPNAKATSAIGRLLFHRWNFGHLNVSTNVESRTALSAKEIVNMWDISGLDVAEIVSTACRLANTQLKGHRLFSQSEIGYALCQQAPGIENWLFNLVSDSADRTSSQVALRKWVTTHKDNRKVYHKHAGIAKAFNNPDLKLIKVMEEKVEDLRGGRFEGWP